MTLSCQEYGLGYGAGPAGYLNSQVSLDGNYVRYSGLTVPDFSLVAVPAAGSGSTAINGIEILGYRNVSELSTCLVVIFGAELLVFRRRKKSEIMSDYTRYLVSISSSQWLEELAERLSVWGGLDGSGEQ